MAKAKFKVGDIVEYSNKHYGIPEGKQFKIIGTLYWGENNWVLEPDNHEPLPFYQSEEVAKIHGFTYIPERLLHSNGQYAPTIARCISVPKRSKKLEHPYMPYDPTQQEDLDSDI